MKTIPDHVLAVLSAGRSDGAAFFLPPGQLERPLYEAVNKVLTGLGGRWNRAKKGHLFDGDAGDAVEAAVLTGEYSNRKQDFGQFDTPFAVAAVAAEAARIAAGDKVLEPNCGVGNLVRAAEERGGIVTGVEVDAKRLDRALTFCKLAGGSHRGDFLAASPWEALDVSFDVVLMNPPFAKSADVYHVGKALTLLRRGGRLVAIMSASITFRQTGLYEEFRRTLEHHGATIEPLPDGSFKESGTSVNAVLVSLTKR